MRANTLPSLILFVILALIAHTTLFRGLRFHNYLTATSNDRGEIANAPPRYIYCDFGANDGATVDAFLKGEDTLTRADERNAANQGQTRNRGALRADLDLTSQQLWEVYVIEANPIYVDQLLEQRERLVSTGGESVVKSYQLYHSTAIGTSDGFVTFILDNNEDGAAGSTTIADSMSAVGRAINVTSLDVVTFFTHHLRVRVEDTLIVKVDIEGGEYELLRRMITHGLMQYVDKMAVEWHHDNQHVLAEPSDGNKARKAIHDRYVTYHKALMWMLQDGGLHKKLSRWGR